MNTKHFIQVGDTVSVKLTGGGDCFIAGKVLAIPDEHNDEWIIRSKQEMACGETYYIKDYAFILLESKGDAL
jgi:hypothetical protein